MISLYLKLPFSKKEKKNVFLATVVIIHGNVARNMIDILKIKSKIKSVNKEI